MLVKIRTDRSVVKRLPCNRLGADVRKCGIGYLLTLNETNFWITQREARKLAKKLLEVTKK